MCQLPLSRCLSGVKSTLVDEGTLTGVRQVVVAVVVLVVVVGAVVYEFYSPAQHGYDLYPKVGVSGTS